MITYSTLPWHYRLGLMILVPLLIFAFWLLILLLLSIIMPLLVIATPVVMMFFPSYADRFFHEVQKEKTNDVQSN